MYPRVKVRVEEEDDHFSPPNDSVSSLFLRLIDSQSEQEKENQANSPPSIARITKAYITSPATKSLSASKDSGKVKNNKQIVKDAKSNSKANSVPPPRAVLSSPDNDGMIGSRNKLNYARSAASKKRPPEQIKPAGRTHNLSPNVTKSSPNFRKGSKTENVNLNPNVTQSSLSVRKGSKTQNGGLAVRMKKEPLKPVVQRQKARIGDGRKSSSLGI
ncbi:hypothetical protein DITRI_Ditri13aG0107300 [Diplodiscus trichospermus]